ncbi:hypothetical protein HF847_00190 [Clostridium cochlearium]|uniref:hypothetical protein n=1 Tax=Clostridium cochlearium TaxID=1494 RepID=UPI0014592AEC|nr:hypothetical protein [Clostridium cochlearium]MBV1817139.1 hypothetical protein [Bacteroidales bacterium MSK.15.36]MCG4579380.1 hypothetical protein [Clostridium cochlearium]NME94432.1 hypothetical protein [Clostridium cochlearium]NSJ90459.1 hypothetical protein [Coprococcus sp. MSK.21.13]
MNKTKIIQDIIVNIIGISNNLEALAQVLNESILPISEETKTVEKESSKEEAPKPKQPTLEEVREAMAQKNREGHREEVKAVLLKYGAKKLTSLDEKHYADVLKEVGEIK